jgi:hypothetical protein
MRLVPVNLCFTYMAASKDSDESNALHLPPSTRSPLLSQLREYSDLATAGDRFDATNLTYNFELDHALRRWQHQRATLLRNTTHATTDEPFRCMLRPGIDIDKCRHGRTTEQGYRFRRVVELRV